MVLRGLGALLLAVIAVVGPGVAPGLTPAANAAAGDPFDPTVAQSWMLANDPATLYNITYNPDGTVSFAAAGATGSLGSAVNALAFNPRDGYLYAAQLVNGVNRVIKIGQGGVVVNSNVATLPDAVPNITGVQNFIDGTIDPATGTMYLSGNNNNMSTFTKVNLATGTVTTVNLSQTLTGNGIGDWVFQGGFLWTVNGGGDLVKIDPSTGVVTTVKTNVLPDATTPITGPAAYGGGYALGNGNIVFIDNGTGKAYQINMSSGSYTSYYIGDGPAASTNDAASSLGSPTDLVLGKCGPNQGSCKFPTGNNTPLHSYPLGQDPATNYTAGSAATYTFTVYNDGPGVSTGSVVTDTLPAGTTFASSSLSTCVASGSTVTCGVGQLAAGTSTTFTITVNVASGATGPITNTASVMGNEAEVDSKDNTDTHTLAVQLSCTPGSVYALDAGVGFPMFQVDTATGSSVGVVNFTAPPVDINGTQGLNALAIAPGGTAAYAASTFRTASGTISIEKYDPTTGTVAIVGTMATPAFIIGGGIDPTTGLYWLMGYNSTNGGFDFYAFDTNTNTSLGLMFSYPFNTDPTVNTGNGDIAFDATGRMYVLMNNGSTKSQIVTFGPPIPSGNLTASQGTVLASPVDPVTVQANGLAFGADGYLYTQAADGPGGQTVIRKIDPATGDVISSVNVTKPDGTSDTFSRDIASCANPSTITVQKNIVGRKVSTDQFALSVTGNGLSLNNTGTTSGTDLGLQTTEPETAGPVLAIPGKTYTIAETGASGANLADYTISYQCVDTLNNNAVVATGSTSSGALTMPGVSATGSNIVCTFTNTPQNPAITLTKTPDKTTLVAGQTITYTFVAKNTGDVPLSNVQISEGTFNGLGGAMSALTGCSPALGSSLAVNATMTCTATYTVTQADVDRYAQNGTRLTNNASVVGTSPTGVNVTATASASVPAAPVTKLTLTKAAGPLTDANSNGVADVGDTILYSFTVKNDGNVTMTNVAVSDPMLASQSITITCTPTTLAPGATATCTSSKAYTLTAADVAALKVTNVATASGKDPAGTTVTSNPATTTTNLPAISLTKTPSPTSFSTVGQVITYTFGATNTGNTTLTNVTISDPGPVGRTGTWSGVGSCTPSQPATLAPGEMLTCKATYVVTQADLDNPAPIHNQAKVTATSGGYTLTNTATADVPPVQSPALSLVKSSPTTTVTTAGQQVVYTFKATNTGTTTLTGVTISDPGPVGGTGSWTGVVSCTPTQPATLAPGAVLTCSATYTVSQGDINAGTPLVNTATAKSNQTPPTTDTHTVTPVQSPALTLRKSSPTTTITAAGQQVVYTFVATNTGNQTLTGVTITDPGPVGGTGTWTGVVSCTPTQPATLAPGEILTCSATYTVSQGDINAGTPLVNTATATSNQTPPTTDTHTVTPSQAPALSLVKSSSVTTVSTAGQQVPYSFTATNTGNTSLTNVTVTDPGPAGGTGTMSALTCTPAQPATLAPGEVLSCSATYTVSQGDIDANVPLVNTATADSDQTPPTTDDHTVTPVPAPALSLVKTSPTTTVSAAGDQVVYSFTATNSGNTTLTNVTISDPGPAGGTGTMSALTCSPAQPATLAPGELLTCSATYTVSQGDIDAGMALVNTATATSDQTPPTTDDHTVTPVPAPALSLVKTSPTTTVSAAGDQVVYSFVATNNGNTTLTNVTISDPGPAGGTGTMSALTCSPAQPATLAPGEVLTCSATYTVSQGDIDADVPLVNTATATSNETPPTTDDHTVTPVPAPALSLVKTSPTTTVSAAGDQVVYSFTATNNGNTTLTNVTIADPGPAGGTGTMSALTCSPTQPATLAPGEVLTCSATYTVSQGDIDAGTALVNTATATSDQTPPTTDDHTVTPVPAPALSLVKTSPTTTVSAAGDQVVYSFTATNNGNTTLTNVTIADPGPAGGTGTMSALTCSPTQPATLAPGEVLTCSATYTVSQGDIDAGTALVNTATATSDQTPPTTDDHTVTPVPAPALSLVKTSPTTTVSAAGDQVVYSFTATNNGNTTLTNVTIADPGPAGGTGTMSALTCSPTQPATLAPGEVLTCSATYTVSQGDIDADVPLVNIATAGSDQTPPTTDDHTVTPQQAPALVLAKSSPTTTVSAAGDQVVYSFVATNNGNTTLTNVTIADPGPAGGTGTMTALTCSPAQPATLAPGEVLTCSATYTVSQGDIDADVPLVNTATATSNETPPTTDDHTVTPVPAPALSLVKTSPTTTVSAAGDQVVYSFTATNTGNTTLTGVTISDSGPAGGTGTWSGITGCTMPATLAPGELLTCSATYTVSQADLDAGVPLVNTATATSDQTPPTTDDHTVTPQQAPALVLAKTSPTTTVSAAGDQVVYSFTATNTGNTTLTGVTISDSGPASGTGTWSGITGCAMPATLAPGEVLTCSATYTVSQGDIDANVPLVNIATATSNETPPTTDDHTVTPVPAPALSLVKASPTTTVSAAGDQVVYSFTATNTGNTTLTGVTISDSGPAGGTGTWSGITGCTMPATLAPGELLTCTATYTVSQADIDAGAPLVNIATATSDQTPPTTDDHTVTPQQAPALVLVKTSPTTTVSAAGDQVVYSFTATNTGNTTLTGVTISDSGPVGGTGTWSGITGCTMPATLAPGEVLTCSATYTVSQGDIDANKPLVNVATGTSDTTPPTTDDHTVTPVPDPSMHLDKRVASVEDVNKNGLTDAGDEIHYEFVVKNTGNLTITGVEIHDPLVPLVVCDATTLAPGESTTCRPHAAYVITQADVDAGGVRNVATATGDTPDGPIDPPTDTTYTPNDQKPAMSLDKRTRTIMDMNGNGVVDAGDTITYEFLVKNIGTVSLTDVGIHDAKLDGVGISISCPTGPIGAGDSVTCVADSPYVVTAADVAAGGVHNVATATAVPPGGTPVDSPKAHSDVPTEKKCSSSRNRGDSDDVCPLPPVDHLPDTGMPPGMQWLALLAVALMGTGFALTISGPVGAARRRRRKVAHLAYARQ